MKEFSVFIKYVVSPSGFLKDLFRGVKDLFQPKRLSIMFLIVAVAAPFLFPHNKKIVSGIFLFLAFLIQFRMIYKTGDHNRWRKEQIKNLSRHEVKEGASSLPGEHLESRSKSREEDTGENAVDVDNQPLSAPKENGNKQT